MEAYCNLYMFEAQKFSLQTYIRKRLDCKLKLGVLLSQDKVICSLVSYLDNDTIVPARAARQRPYPCAPMLVVPFPPCVAVPIHPSHSVSPHHAPSTAASSTLTPPRRIPNRAQSASPTSTTLPLRRGWPPCRDLFHPAGKPRPPPPPQ
jgi:hypothetical protein